MNQADYFYFSGHGNHASGSIYGVTAPQVTGYWDKDLDTVIIAGCSILDINDYNDRYTGAEHNLSPGELWATAGPSLLLGYNYKAPEDNQGSAAIISTWISEKATKSEIEAWKIANIGDNGGNACAIEVGSAYYYFHRTLVPLPFPHYDYIWTVIPQSAW